MLDELIQQYPERDNLWTLQANIYIQKEQPAKAAISLEMLRRLGKATPQNLYLLGDLYMAQEARDLALGRVSRGDRKGRRPKSRQSACARRKSSSAAARGMKSRKLFAKIRSAGDTERRG